MDYRKQIYERYVSMFKGKLLEERDYGFSDSKLIPLLFPWVTKLDRETSCLDLGCGHGNILHALKTLGFSNITGLDASAEQVNLATAVTSDVRCMDILEYMRTNRESKYGLITLFDVIEHLTKPEILELLSNISRSLKPGGLFICHCPNGDSPFALNIYAGDFTHETILNRSSARLICNLSGLTQFSATEDLGASRHPLGYGRRILWSGLRLLIAAWNLIETGSCGSRIWTRNFAFKAEKSAADPIFRDGRST